jgi:hypothetical protein
MKLMSLNYAPVQGNMMARNWFGVGVRLIGVWEIVSGLDELVTYGNVLLGFYRTSLTSPIGFLTHAIVHLLVGLFLLFSAMGVVNSVYPPSNIINEEPTTVK